MERTRLPGRALALTAAISLTPLAVLLSPSAFGQVVSEPGIEISDEVRGYDIPAGPLGDVLSRFASEAGLLLSADAALTAGIDSNGLDGEYTVAEALHELLTGTDLQARFTAADTVTVVAAPDDRETLDPITVGAARESATGPVDGYRASRTATATRTDRAIQDTPASVQVVPREVIDDQASFDLGEVLQNVSNTTSAEGSTLIESRESVFTRGFRSRAVFYDGFRADAVPTLDLANIERVEVLKGPSSIVVGQIEPGGMVNLVPKRPPREASGHVGLEVGEFSFRRGTVDIGGTTVDGGVGARIIGSVTDSDSFRDFQGLERRTVTPSLRAEIGERARVELEIINHREERDVFEEGVAFDADGSEADDIDTFLGGPDFDGSDFDWDGLRATAEVDLTDSVTLRGGAFYQDFDHDWEAFRPFGDPGEEPTRGAPDSAIADDEIFRFYANTQLDIETIEARLETLSNFSTAGWDHELLVGVNFRDLDREIRETRGFDVQDPNTGELFPQKINIEAPQYGDPIPTQRVADGRLDGEQEELGLYITDSIVGGQEDQWNVLAGLRYEEVEQEVVEDRAQDRLLGSGGTTRLDKTDDEVTSRFGLLYRAAPGLAPFASFSQSFVPSGTKVSGDSDELLDATTANQVEAGVKFGVLGGALTGTAAAFRIEREDVPIQDPNDRTRFVNGGEQESEGFEIDVAGQPTDSVNVLASLGYVDAEWTDSTRVDEGTPLRGVPDYTASVTTRWEIPSGPLQGLRLSGSVFSADDRPGDDRNSFELDGFTTLRLGVARDWRLGGERISTRITVKNVTDERHFVASNSKSSVVPGPPRTVRAGLEWHF